MLLAQDQETNIENLRMKMEECKRSHGPPNYEIHLESLKERYQYFVQYALHWPCGNDIRKGLHTVNLEEISDTSRASAMRLVGYSQEETKGGTKTYQACYNLISLIFMKTRILCWFQGNIKHH